MGSTTSTPEDEVPPDTVRPCVSNILDIPYEIWIKIILHLNARDRVALGNSCKHFYDLVFKDKELLRNLDFSEDGWKTSASDIQQYFNSAYARSRILGVNVRDTVCMKPGAMLNDSIGKARNLVDINVHGIRFIDFWQLTVFLDPLRHVQKLSFDWPETDETLIPTCCKFLQKPFSKLRYLSVEMKHLSCSKVFIHVLRLCQELEKLRLVILESGTNYIDNRIGEPGELKNLKVMEYCGPAVIAMKERFGTLLPKNNKWADFKLSTSEAKGFYLEIVDVCQELVDSNWIQRISNVTAEYECKFGWALVPELLLKEVLRITHEDVPEEFCCLSPNRNSNRCLLKIDELKALLKNPRSQVSYLYLDHPVSLGCDVHLVASAFENLTELVLGLVTRDMKSSPMESHFERRLRRRGDHAPEKLNKPLNLDSSFKMLVKNSPRLRHFTLSNPSSSGPWDLSELHLISKWKCLVTLRLLSVPLNHERFLLEIGKECKNLQTLELRLSEHVAFSCYEGELILMLRLCKNLRDFSITGKEIGTISGLFTSLGNNPELRRVHVKTGDQGRESTKYDWTAYASPIKRLSLQCPMLTSFLIECSTAEPEYRWINRISLELKSLKKDLKRPNLQIQVNCWTQSAYGSRCMKEIGDTHEKKTHPKPFDYTWTAN